MADHPINGLMQTALSSIKQMVDVNTIVGTPISTADGTTIIPVSKVSFGFGSGGCDIPSKVPLAQGQDNCFGGGSGAGVSIIPVAFLVSSNGYVKLMPVAASTTTVDRVIDSVPGVVDKISGFMKDWKNKKDSKEA